MLYIQVAIPLPLFSLFTYKSQDEISAGCRVRVNFNNKNIIGVVINCSKELLENIPPNKIKNIIEIIDRQPFWNTDTLKLLSFASKYQIAPLGEIIDIAQPAILRKGEPARQQPIKAYKIIQKDYKGKNQQQIKIIETLRNKTLTYSECISLGYSLSVIKTLIKNNVIEEFDLNNQEINIYENLIFRNKLKLNEEQKKIVDKINEQNNKFNIFLIDGVTGSGKTEVYLQLIEKILEQKKQILIMVPEIGLTPQTIERFNNRFNVPIAAMHSSLSDRKRLDNYLACRDGRIAILIGTRSSVFTPFKNLGLIVIDEEHDGSFKQQDTCRYNGKYLAIYKAKIANCPIVLGSATPSFESIYNCHIGKYQYFKLENKAVNKDNKTNYEIIDIRNQNLKSGISEKLLNEIKNELEKDNQVLIFLNKRGYANQVLCKNCGFVLQCNNCDSFLTFHKTSNRLSCHHCDSIYPIPKTCPNCNCSEFEISGNGTEQIEEFMKIEFPNYPIARIDRDSISKPNKLTEYLSGIKNGTYKILIGTQILAKGHHFPNITLIAILNIDASLFSNDFRSTEYLAQLFIQISGRTGRENKTGKVILQSYNPNHIVLQTLIAKGYKEFVKLSLQERKYLKLPPFSFQTLLRIESTKKELLNSTSILIYKKLLFSKQLGFTNTEISTPYPALMEKKQGKYHMLIMVQSNNRTELSKFLSVFTRSIKSEKMPYQTTFYIDVDPTEILQ